MKLHALHEPINRKIARKLGIHDAALVARPRRRGYRMRRRDLIVMLAGVATVPCRLVSAQQHAQPLVAFLNPRISEINLGAFRHGLHELGYVEGQNIALEVRSAEGDNRRLPALAAELAGLKPDVVVTSGEPATRAIKEAAGTIPIVMAIVDDPVALGFAQSLARPGGNLTGLTILATGVLGKRLQMLYETLPNPGCVAVLGVAAPITTPILPANLPPPPKHSGWRCYRSRSLDVWSRHLVVRILDEPGGSSVQALQMAS